jgi:hypothetical protein
MKKNEMETKIMHINNEYMNEKLEYINFRDKIRKWIIFIDLEIGTLKKLIEYLEWRRPLKRSNKQILQKSQIQLFRNQTQINHEESP